MIQGTWSVVAFFKPRWNLNLKILDEKEGNINVVPEIDCPIPFKLADTGWH
jgi:hypothetical protein